MYNFQIVIDDLNAFHVISTYEFTQSTCNTPTIRCLDIWIYLNFMGKKYYFKVIVLISPKIFPAATFLGTIYVKLSCFQGMIWRHSGLMPPFYSWSVFIALKMSPFLRNDLISWLSTLFSFLMSAVKKWFASLTLLPSFWKWSLR